MVQLIALDGANSSHVVIYNGPLVIYLLRDCTTCFHLGRVEEAEGECMHVKHHDLDDEDEVKNKKNKEMMKMNMDGKYIYIYIHQLITSNVSL